MRILIDKTGQPVCLVSDVSIPVAEADVVIDMTGIGPTLRLVIPITVEQLLNLYEQEKEQDE